MDYTLNYEIEKNMLYVMKIKDLEIPFYIKNYKTAKSMKIYFKEVGLTITKSPYVPKIEVDRFIRQNEEKIYEEYKKIIELKHLKKERWETGQDILYGGDLYKIFNSYHKEKTISIRIEKETKLFKIFLPNQIQKEKEIDCIQKTIKELFKENTEEILKERLIYWSKKTNILYNSVKVRDAKTKYGSCIPKTRALHFSARLVMLKKEAIDAIIVHELCHIVYPNHSKQFYELVKKYVPNYDDINNYLKKNSKLIVI